MKTKQITFAGLAIALAMVISTIIRLTNLPNGCFQNEKIMI